jgi:hypothetical protein
MNLKFALKVREDLDKLLDIGFIYPIETTQWLSPLVIVPKKNGKLQIYVDCHKLNVQTKKDPFPLPFLDLVLDSIVQHERYSFMDGYNSYSQVKMVEKDKDKTTFTSKWGAYAYNIIFLGCVMPLLLSKK